MGCFFDGYVNPFYAHIFAEEESSLHASNDDGPVVGAQQTSTLTKHIKCKDSESIARFPSPLERTGVLVW